jgi:hypothetical protein
VDLKLKFKELGGQGVYREVESEGHEEKYRAVINGGHPKDEPVGQRWDKVEPALLGRRRSHSPTAPRCLRTARYGRTTRDLRRTGKSAGGTAVSDPISDKRKGKRCCASCRTARILPMKRSESCVTGMSGAELGKAMRP